MTVTMLKSSEEEALFKIEIDANTIENAITEEFIKSTEGKNKQSQGLPLSNRAMMANHPELDKIAAKALNNILPSYYMSALKELNLNPMTYPKIMPQETKLGDPCIVKIQIALEPKVTLGEYTELKASYVPIIVTDDDVKQQIEGIRKQRGAENDEKLIENLPFDSIEAFAEEVRTSLMSLAQESTERNIKKAVISKLIDVNPCQLKEEVVEQQIMLQINQFRQQIGGKKFDDYLKSTNKSLEDAKKEIRPEAETAVKKNLLLAAVADHLQLEITEEDIKKTLLQQENSIMDMALDFDARLKRLEETPGAKEQLVHTIRLEKATDYIIDKAVLNAEEPVRVLEERR
ncbi:trigger factor [uncultured Desulfuromusa sp.]|uniref:trigger factor n=1 Tax=uncultured Desulfuromusa sp. TaxID=219183 RepID=UPI002AA9447E|nr:trigger factor [uncultured Desulfuromusa sp.]